MHISDDEFVASATKQVTDAYDVYHAATCLIRAYQHWQRTQHEDDPSRIALCEQWMWDALFCREAT